MYKLLFVFYFQKLAVREGFVFVWKRFCVWITFFVLLRYVPNLKSETGGELFSISKSEYMSLVIRETIGNTK